MSIEDLFSKQDLGRWLVEHLESEPLSMSAVEGLQQAVTAGSWQELVLLGGWANFTASIRNASYRTEPGGKIALGGLVAKAATPNGTVIATLPPAARPTTPKSFPASTELEIGRIQIEANGNIVYLGEFATLVPLDQISFWPGA